MPDSTSRERRRRRGAQDRAQNQGMPRLPEVRPAAGQAATRDQTISSPRPRIPPGAAISTPARAPRTPPNRTAAPSASTRHSSPEDRSAAKAPLLSGLLGTELEAAYFAVDRTTTRENIARVEWLIQENEKLIEAHVQQRADFDHLRKLSNDAASHPGAPQGGGKAPGPLDDMLSLMEAIAETSNSAINETVMQLQQLEESNEALRRLLAARDNPALFKARYEEMVGCCFPSPDERQAKVSQRSGRR